MSRADTCAVQSHSEYQACNEQQEMARTPRGCAAASALPRIRSSQRREESSLCAGALAQVWLILVAIRDLDGGQGEQGSDSRLQLLSFRLNSRQAPLKGALQIGAGWRLAAGGGGGRRGADWGDGRLATGR
jgi:hypothetical protein